MSPRHTDCTPGITQAIADIVRAGNYPGPAAELCGVDDTTATGWMRRGAADVQAGVESIYSVFFAAVKRAEAEAEQEMIAVVRSAATHDKNWLAAMTYLQRRHPDRWGVRDGFQASGPVNITFNVRYTPRIESEGAFTVLPDTDTAKQLPEPAIPDTANVPVEDLPF